MTCRPQIDNTEIDINVVTAKSLAIYFPTHIFCIIHCDWDTGLTSASSRLTDYAPSTIFRKIRIKGDVVSQFQKQKQNTVEWNDTVKSKLNTTFSTSVLRIRPFSVALPSTTVFHLYDQISSRKQ